MSATSRTIVVLLAAFSLVGGAGREVFGQSQSGTGADPGAPSPRSSADLQRDIEQLTRLFADIEAQQDQSVATEALRGTLETTHEKALERFRLGDVGPDSARAVRDLPRLLIRAHVAYKDLKSEVSRTMSTRRRDASQPQPDLVALERALADLAETEHRVLSRNDLYEPIGAVLRGGYSLADPGDNVGGGFERGDLKAEHTAAMFVEFESKHFRDEESRVDYSYGGRTGFLPLMAVVARRPEPAAAGTAAAATPQPSLLPAFQNGFAWSLNGRASIQLPGESEFSGVVRAGQGRLDSLTVKLGEGEGAKLADVVRNGVGRWAWSHEAGVEFRAYRQDLAAAHLQKEFLLPMFSLSTGLRWDERLKDVGSAGASASADERWFFRFTVNLVKVVDSRLEGAQAKPFALRVSVDHDHARRASTVPSGTRLFLEADANLLKLLKPGGR
jgi:hypothetical protein